MKHWGVYRIRLQKNKISKPSRYRCLRWCVTEGDGDGHSICLKDADTSDSRSVSGNSLDPAIFRDSKCVDM